MNRLILFPLVLAWLASAQATVASNQTALQSAQDQAQATLQARDQQVERRGSVSAPTERTHAATSLPWK